MNLKKNILNHLAYVLLTVLILSKAQAQIYIDTLLTDMMESSHLPGLACLIIKNDQIIFENYYGYANIEDNQLITDSTVFMLASVSKTFAGVSLMQLYEAGVFELDDNINDYLDFQVINPWYPILPITFRQLLTHTSSIKGDFSTGSFNIPIPSWGHDHPMTIGELCQEHFEPGGNYYAESNYNEAAPGSQWDYSSVATTLAARLVEVLSGQTYEDYCRENIFEPLNMNHTSWFLANLNTDLLASHYEWENGDYEEYPPRGTPIYPCGWLKTSLRQLGNYLMTMMQSGEFNNIEILQPESVEQITTVQFPDIPVYLPNKKWGLMWSNLQNNGRYLW